MQKEMLERLIEQGYSIRIIAEKLSLTVGSIRHWLKKYDLKTKYIRTTECICRQCGTTDVSKFYKYRLKLCISCDNMRVLNKQRVMRDRMRTYLGGKCSKCGYNICNAALEVHHLDPSKKDPTFHSGSGWSWSRVEKELQGCILLCSNCHREEHAGIA
jgi:hypothetical protein